MTAPKPTKRVLVAPLDWRLGHATRCIPIIRMLLDQGQEVVLAAKGAPAALLSEEFPSLPVVPIVNYNIRYAATPLLLKLKFPQMLARVFYCAWLERRQTRRIVERHGIGAIISDNRFGCHCRSVPSVYLSHQLLVKMPHGFSFLERPLWMGHRWAMGKFNELWIPDLPGEDNLTGDLTRRFPLPTNHRFVGLLSRFGGSPSTGGPANELDLLVMLSGPEPQRTQLENVLLPQLRSYQGKAVVLLGKAGSHTSAPLSSTVTVVSHMRTSESVELVRNAKAIVCRGGYTTIMELLSLGKRAVIVPTPGQTEQEYLCGRLAAKGLFVVRQQESLDLAEGLAALKGLRPEPQPSFHSELLQDAVSSLVQATRAVP
jgi:UDP:flavonoid glycosyltransferase YjiC (YdhE family)